MTEGGALRILCCCSTWQGATDYGWLRAFRRAGHSVNQCPGQRVFPAGWRSPALRLLRRATAPLLLADYQRALIAAARAQRPDLFFVFKGTFVTPQSIAAVQRLGAVAINVYPDVSFTVHGRLIPLALPLYDWVFTTKSYGVADLARELGVTRASFLPHGFDPETHAPVALDEMDARFYACDAVFVGTWSPKKEALLRRVKERLPGLALKIWGEGWRRSALVGSAECCTVIGREYAKAITGAKINIAMLAKNGRSLFRRPHDDAQLRDSRDGRLHAA